MSTLLFADVGNLLCTTDNFTAKAGHSVKIPDFPLRERLKSKCACSFVVDLSATDSAYKTIVNFQFWIFNTPQLQVLENIEVHKKSQYAHIPACQISTSYYVGFAYMMMRRYSDAIRTFSSILLYIQRTKQLFASKTYQHDQINKQTDQMYHLLAICLVLHPQCIDESIQQTLREKSYHEKMYKMQYGDLQEFENSFVYACPKFLSPYPPPIDSLPGDYSKEAIQHQTQVFMEEVAQQKMLPTIRSYLKLYTTLPLSKLATFMAQNSRTSEASNRDLDKEMQSLVIHLLCFKHKMKNVVWSKGASGLEGKFQSGSEVRKQYFAPSEK